MIFNAGSALPDPISQSLYRFGNSVGGELFLPKFQTGKYFYGNDDNKTIPNGLAFYSTAMASSYHYLDERTGTSVKKNCPLRLYIEETADTLHDNEREQPSCSCCPENHLHVFRLPFIYFLIDGIEKQGRHQEIIEVLRTLKNHKIYTNSTNKDPSKMNLADKLIKLSQQNFDDEKTLRLVLIFYT